jgi:peptide chain release factor
MKNIKEKIIQITSGKGPEECERVVFLVFEKMQKELIALGLICTIVEECRGNQKATLLSIVFKVSGENCVRFCTDWEGTIQWVAPSIYRKNHKRKNWFVGTVVHDCIENTNWNEHEINFQTLRSSGPGGQNVNKVESAVRATHLPTGISVLASTNRSQLMNKKEAVERLKNKLFLVVTENNSTEQQKQWMEHNELERGNAIKIFKESM